MLKVLIVVSLVGWGAYEAVTWHQDLLRISKTHTPKSKLVFPSVRIGAEFATTVTILNNSDNSGTCVVSEHNAVTGSVVKTNYTTRINPEARFVLKIGPSKLPITYYLVMIAECEFVAAGVIQTTNLEKNTSHIELAY